MKRNFVVFMLFFSAALCYGQDDWRSPVQPWRGIDVSASSQLSDATGLYPAGNLIDSTWRSWAEGSPQAAMESGSSESSSRASVDGDNNTLSSLIIGIIIVIVLAGGFAAIKIKNEKDSTGGDH